MKFLIKAFFLSFALIQAVQAGRMYDPEIGRFISRDPVGYVDGMSLYNAYFAEKFALDPMGTKIVTKRVPGYGKGKGIEIKYEQPDKCPCKYIDFIQVVQTYNPKTGEPVKTASKKVTTEDYIGVDGVDAAQGVPVKMPSSAQNPYYVGDVSVDPQTGEQTYNPTHENGNDSGGRKTKKDARMYDNPGVNANLAHRFEVCVICVDDGRILGCVTWTVKDDGKGEKTFDVGEQTEGPTDFYKKGVKAYDDYADKYKRPTRPIHKSNTPLK